MRNTCLSFLLLLSACAGLPGSSSSHEPSEPTGPATCHDVADRMLAVQGERMLHDVLEDARPDWRGQIVTSVTSGCTDDQWPADAIECGAGAADADALNTCVRALSDDQQSKYAARIDALRNAIRDEAPVSALEPVHAGARHG